MHFIITHPREVAMLTGEHLWLVSISTLIAVAMGVPLGILLTRQPKLKAFVQVASFKLIPALRCSCYNFLAGSASREAGNCRPRAVCALARGIVGVSAPVREAALAVSCCDASRRRSAMIDNGVFWQARQPPRWRSPFPILARRGGVLAVRLQDTPSQRIVVGSRLNNIW